MNPFLNIWVTPSMRGKQHEYFCVEWESHGSKSLLPDNNRELDNLRNCDFFWTHQRPEMVTQFRELNSKERQALLKEMENMNYFTFERI